MKLVEGKKYMVDMFNTEQNTEMDQVALTFTPNAEHEDGKAHWSIDEDPIDPAWVITHVY